MGVDHPILHLTLPIRLVQVTQLQNPHPKKTLEQIQQLIQRILILGLQSQTTVIHQANHVQCQMFYFMMMEASFAMLVKEQIAHNILTHQLQKNRYNWAIQLRMILSFVTQADDNTTVCPITIVGDKPNDDPCAPDHIPQPKPFSYDPDVNVISHYTENWNGQITKDWLTTNCFSSSGTAYPQTWVHPSGKRIVLLSDSLSQPADSQQPSTEDSIITEIKIYASECNAQKTELINTSDQLKASGSGSPNYATEYNELANSFNKFSSEMYEVTYPRVVELEKERDTVDS